MNENFRFRLFSRARAHARRTALPGREHFQGSDWTIRKLPEKLVLRRPRSVSRPNQKDLQLDRKRRRNSHQ